MGIAEKARQREMERTLAKLRGLWSCFPQLRLSQLLVNVINSTAHGGNLRVPEIFFVEDDRLGTMMDDFYRAHYQEAETDGR